MFSSCSVHVYCSSQSLGSFINCFNCSGPWHTSSICMYNSLQLYFSVKDFTKTSYKENIWPICLSDLTLLEFIKFLFQLQSPLKILFTAWYFPHFFLLSQGAYKSVIFVMQLEITLSNKEFSKTLLQQNDPLTKYQMFWMKFLIIQSDAPTTYWFTSSPATGRAPPVLVSFPLRGFRSILNEVLMLVAWTSGHFVLHYIQS